MLQLSSVSSKPVALIRWSVVVCVGAFEWLLVLLSLLPALVLFPLLPVEVLLLLLADAGFAAAACALEFAEGAALVVLVWLELEAASIMLCCDWIDDGHIWPPPEALDTCCAEGGLLEMDWPACWLL